MRRYAAFPAESMPTTKRCKCCGRTKSLKRFRHAKRVDRPSLRVVALCLICERARERNRRRAKSVIDRPFKATHDEPVVGCGLLVQWGGPVDPLPWRVAL